MKLGEIAKKLIIGLRFLLEAEKITLAEYAKAITNWCSILNVMELK
jgi:hypothetical protein